MKLHKVTCDECPFMTKGDDGDYFCQIFLSPLSAPDECLLDDGGNYVLALISAGRAPGKYAAIAPRDDPHMWRYGVRPFGVSGVSFYGYYDAPDADKPSAARTITLFNVRSIEWPNAGGAGEIVNFVNGSVKPEF